MFLFKENNRYFNNNSNNCSFNHNNYCNNNNNNNNYEYLNKKNFFSFSRRNPIKIFEYNLDSSNFHKAQNSYTPNINSFNKASTIEEKRNITPFININNNNDFKNEEKKLFNLKKNRCINLPILNHNKFNLLNDYQNSYNRFLNSRINNNKNYISYENNNNNNNNSFSTSVFNNSNNSINFSENNINYNNNNNNDNNQITNLKKFLSLNDNDLLYPKSDIKNYNISNLSNNIYPTNNNKPIKNRNSFHYLIPEKKSTLKFISNFMFKK